MQTPSHKDFCMIHINEAFDDYNNNNDSNSNSSSSKVLSFSAMKLFHRFRKILMRLMLTLPSSSGRRNCGGSRRKHGGSGGRGGGGERLEPPKMSCSSYYSSHSHYSEAIADCIEFFNKSSGHQSHDEDREEDHQVIHDHDYYYV